MRKVLYINEKAAELLFEKAPAIRPITSNEQTSANSPSAATKKKRTARTFNTIQTPFKFFGLV